MAAGVSIEKVVKRFGGLRAVDGVSLEIEPGELFFLLGPSGCGKTTLLRCIAGFHRPDEGAIRIGGKDITHEPPHRRDTGMVFQSYALWPHMTVRENVAFGLEMRKLPREEVRRRADEALAQVHMSDRAGHRPAQLSGGQQQRVALARALVVHPKCLLLDEPLSNLDAKLRIEMRSEIRRICKGAGLTAIYVTHDQKEAMSIADRLAILNAGRVEQCGRPNDVYQHPANRFVAGFIGETNFLDGRVESRAGAGGRVATPFGPVDAADVGGAAAGADVTLALRPEALRLAHGGAPAAAHVFRGEVLETAYLGEVVQQQVRLRSANGGAGAAAPVFRVFELRPTVVARDGQAEPALLAIAPADVVVLPR
ncbi:MAG: ABC transporter ATP-binding protein [Verrucomicrobia bacterium]|nr:ABC transporter ATP-binding protein [Verrucomicrobiota bacterium]